MKVNIRHEDGFFVCLVPVKNEKCLNVRKLSFVFVGFECNLSRGRWKLPTTVLEERCVLVGTKKEEWEEFFFPQNRTVLVWCEKSWILTTQKFFAENHKFEFDFKFSFFSTKVWTTKSENLLLWDHLSKTDIFLAVQILISFFQFF